MNRRYFFELLAGAAIAPVAAKAAALLPSVPILWGDNIHDDGPALNALFRGEVVDFMDAGMAKHVSCKGGILTIPEGTFRIKEAINLNASQYNKLIANKTTIRPVKGGTGVRLSNLDDVKIYDCGGLRIELVADDISADPIKKDLNPHNNRPSNDAPRSFKK